MSTYIKSVSDLLSLLEKFNYQFSQTHRTDGFIFRGMSDKKWKLLPGVLREFEEEQKSELVEGGAISGNIYISSEIEILSHFKKEAGGILTHVPQADDLTWLQYAQHYGVPTRLLDFTANPLVALYFCCQSESKTDGSLWIINTVNFHRWSRDEDICKDEALKHTRKSIIDSILLNMSSVSPSEDEELTKSRPVLFIPPYIDQRMSAQSSRFMLWGNNDSALDDMGIKDNEMVLCPDGMRIDTVNDQRFWTKLIIPSICKHSLMRELDLLNINEKSIFPGLDGIGKYVNKYHKSNPDDILDFF